MNNKTLAIVLGVLVAVFAISQFTASNKSRSFDPNVLTVDEGSVDALEVTIAGGSTSLLSKKEGQWYVSNGSQEFLADEFAVTSVLGELESVKAKKVVARSEEKAVGFETNEAAATRIVAKRGNEVLADVNIGRFSFDQQSRQPISYIKKSNEEETYLVQSFLAMSMKKDFNSLRDKSFLALNKADIQVLQISTPISDMSISPNGNNWETTDGIALDSSGVQKFLDGLADLKGTTFSEGADSRMADYTMTISLKDGTQSTITASKFEEDNYILYSSAHPQNVFESNQTGLFKKVFTDLEHLLLVTGDL